MSIEKIQWVVMLISRLMREEFEGTLMLDFAKGGHISKKYRIQRVEYCEDNSYVRNN